MKKDLNQFLLPENCELEMTIKFQSNPIIERFKLTEKQKENKRKLKAFNHLTKINPKRYYLSIHPEYVTETNKFYIIIYLRDLKGLLCDDDFVTLEIDNRECQKTLAYKCI